MPEERFCGEQDRGPSPRPDARTRRAHAELRLPLSDLVAHDRESLPAVVVAVGVAYAVNVVLLGAASAAAYREIMDEMHK